MKKQNHNSIPKEVFLETFLENIEFVIFDLEATGGNPLKSGLTEVFAISFEKEETETKSFHSLINPHMRIPSIVRELTKITNEMVRDAPTAEEVMPAFFEFIKGKVLVSHNTLCDIKFLDHYSRKLNKIPLENFFLCTHLLSEKLIPESQHKSLSGLCAHLGIILEPNHRAEQDAICTKDLFSHILKKLDHKGIKTLKEAIVFQGDLASAIKIGWEIEESSTKKIPRTVGTLSFQGPSKETLLGVASPDCHEAFHKLKNLAQLPKQLARILTKAHKLEFLKHDNLLEAKLTTLVEEEKNSRSLEKLHLGPHFTFGLAIIKISRDLYEFSVSHPIEKNLFFYGPFINYKSAEKLLQFLAETLFDKKPQRGKFLLDSEDLEILTLVLAKEKYRYLLRSLRFLLKKRSLKQYLESFSSFSYLEKFHNTLTNLREESGLLFLENLSPSPGGKIYSILFGQLGESLTITQAYDSWLTSRQGIEFIRQFLLNLPQSQSISTKPLTKKEASVFNLILGFRLMQNPRKNKKSSIFTSKEKLIELTKSNYET